MKTEYPIDFSTQPWELRNGRIVADLEKRAIVIPNQFPVRAEMGWTESSTRTFWDQEGNHAFAHSGSTCKMASVRNSLLDIIKPAPVVLADAISGANSLPAFQNSMSTLSTKPRKRVFVVTGGSSGLGKAICLALMAQEDGPEVYNIDRSFNHGAIKPGVYPNYYNINCDLESASVILRSVDFLPQRVDALINCAGVNHIEWMPKIKEKNWDHVMNVNARAIFFMSQAMLSRLQIDDSLNGGTILNIVSNASHVPMTNSLAYNASKAAAHMMTLQMARELSKSHGITVFGLSPNKMAGTRMSKYIESRVPELRGWTAEKAAEYQKASLLNGEETDVDTVAEFVAFLLSSKQRHKFLSGCVIPYGA